METKLYACGGDGTHEELPPRAMITVELRSVYGRPIAYPSGPRSECVAHKLLGMKTLSLSHLEALEELGFEVRDALGRDWRKVLSGGIRI